MAASRRPSSWRERSAARLFVQRPTFQQYHEKGINDGMNWCRTSVRDDRWNFLGKLVIGLGLFLWVALSIVTVQFLPSTTSHLTLTAPFLRPPMVILNDDINCITTTTTTTTATTATTETEAQRKKHDHGTNNFQQLYNLSYPPPTELPYRVLHTVTTRFMVGQPHQPTLARARYILFETFCWPTMRYQIRQNFFWLVLVDPRIDDSVLRDIQSLLSSMPTQNAYMILTDNAVWAGDGVGVPGVDSYGVGLQELGREYQAGNVQILTGNTTFLLDALKIINDQYDSLVVLIETLLDADDGMHTSGIEWIQTEALQHTIRQHDVTQTNSKIVTDTTLAGDHSNEIHQPVSLNSTWWLMCGTDHIEWHNREIYQLTSKEYQARGLTSGITGIRHAPVYCASAGYTRVGLTRSAAFFSAKTITEIESGNDLGIPLLKFPRVAYSNHALTEEFPRCNDGLDFLQEGQKISNDTIISECFRRVFPNLPFVLKSRTITSDSMDHMSTKQDDYRDLPWQNKSEYPLWVNETERSWLILEHDFKINRMKVWKTSIYLRENIDSIVDENRNAHCAPGFPCREVANLQFKLMRNHLKAQNRKDTQEALRNGIT